MYQWVVVVAIVAVVIVVVVVVCVWGGTWVNGSSNSQPGGLAKFDTYRPRNPPPTTRQAYCFDHLLTHTISHTPRQQVVRLHPKISIQGTGPIFLFLRGKIVAHAV